MRQLSTFAELDAFRLDPGDLCIQKEYPTVEAGYGSVKIASYRGKLVAVKTLRLHGSDDDRERLACVRIIQYPLSLLKRYILQRLARELKVWAPLDHPNIIPLTGFTLMNDLSSAQLVSPYAENGHIGSFLKKAKQNEVVRMNLVRNAAPVV